MTKRGNFIINGNPRIIINQLIRAEGLYYRQQIQTTYQNQKNQFFRTVFVDIISKRGVWIRFEMDKKRQIWVCMKKTPKIPIFLFLSSLGFHHKTLYKNFMKFQPHTLSTEPKLPFISYFLKNIDLAKSPSPMVFQKFLNIQNYDLGLCGRERLNKKLNLSTQKTTLTPLDFLRITYLLLDFHDYQSKFDDIDDLQNRRLRTIGELLQLQIHQSLYRLHRLLTEKSKKSSILPYLFTTTPLDSHLQEFFGSSPLSQFLDQINPLAEITHKRRLTSLGPNGVKKESAGMDIRSIHSTYFGRICPIETPEGHNAGLVNSLSLLTLPDRHGFLQSVYFKSIKDKYRSMFNLTIEPSHKKRVLI